MGNQVDFCLMEPVGILNIFCLLNHCVFLATHETRKRFVFVLIAGC